MISHATESLPTEVWMPRVGDRLTVRARVRAGVRVRVRVRVRGLGLGLGFGFVP